MTRSSAQGFTLIEVMIALVVVALGLSALMIAVSGTARTTGYLRDKTLAQWIAMNRLTEVRLNTSKFSQNTDTGELKFANRTWHYDTRYFDTSFASMKRVVVRVYAGDAKAKGNPVAEASTFLGADLNAPGTSNNTDWSKGLAGDTSSSTNPTNPTGTAVTPTGNVSPGAILPVAPTPTPVNQ